ncbi:anthranilate phosphoribosyltransferase [Candidatus Protochlamydia phocaeensis]|uniref:anthranilate phosphoribosyltransferase n=1 Tax=Candidatus Protochlamydia phocaeensis TaxID=1414722 RepID=UPI000838BB3B|nr:anthranilate phosphoribosyltransferase [Candidatus Protochlamydia phocaeensis]
MNTYEDLGKELLGLESYLHLLFSKKELTRQQAEAVMDLIVEEANPYQAAALLSILKYRGETADEVIGFLSAFAKRALPVHLPYPVLDIVGTGGDLANTVNISTGSAILAAACGIPVAKHGNRSLSSRSGAADVLEALGVEVEIPPDRIGSCLVEANISFLFAPYYHPSLKKLGPIRKGLKLPTACNLLGILLNPAKAEYSLIGVAQASLLELVSEVILKLGNRKRTLVFHGCGLDELSPLGPAIAYDISNGKKERLEIDPLSLGLPSCSLSDLQGGDAQANAAILKEVFAGRKCAVADALIFNAGAALWVFERTPSLQEGIHVARRALETGQALQVLEKWRQFSMKLKQEQFHEQPSLS